MKLVVSNHEEALLNSSTKPIRSQLAYQMLSQQTSDLTPGRHQRQNSTPTVFDTHSTLHPATLQRNELHRRGPSLDQQAYADAHNGISQQDENTISVEDILRQRLTQQTMREAQQQQKTARPGFDGMLGQQQLQQYLMNFQETQRLEPGPGYHTCNYHTTQLTDLNETLQHSLVDENKNTTMAMFHGIDSTSSAGNLDGFGNRLEGFTGNMQPNIIMNTNQMPNGSSSRNSSQRPTSSEGPQRPCTPAHQTRACKSNVWLMQLTPC